jgi:hypothetical protein
MWNEAAMAYFKTITWYFAYILRGKPRKFPLRKTGLWIEYLGPGQVP